MFYCVSAISNFNSASDDIDNSHLGGRPRLTTGICGGVSCVRSTVGGLGGRSTCSLIGDLFCLFCGTANCPCSCCFLCELVGMIEIAEFRLSAVTFKGCCEGGGLCCCWGGICCLFCSLVLFLFAAGVTVIPRAARTFATALASDFFPPGFDVFWT